jgi:hypothetical protein
MNNCPDVLSAGKLVMEHGFSFNWLPYMKPTLTDTKGRIIELALENLVPILPQKNGSVTRVNLSAVPALPGEPDFEGTHIPQTPPRVEGSEVPRTPTHGDAAPGTPPLPRRERQIGIALGHDHLMTHFPKCNECDVCIQAKMYMAPARRRDPDLRDLKAENFADLLWSDHIIVGKNKVSRGNKGEKVGLLIYDVATHIQDIPAEQERSEHFHRADVLPGQPLGQADLLGQRRGDRGCCRENEDGTRHLHPAQASVQRPLREPSEASGAGHKVQRPAVGIPAPLLASGCTPLDVREVDHPSG